MRVVFVLALAGALYADPQGAALKRKGFLTKGPAGGGPMADVVERFSRMTPSERREALGNLPPERRRMMERRLDAWANTPPEERKRLEGSYARFQEMSPERQQEVRQLFRRFSETFDPERRPKAHAAIRQLRRADAEERKRMLGSKQFQERFSEDERKVIEQMVAELPER